MTAGQHGGGAPAREPSGQDATTAYFDEHCHDYSPGRMAFAYGWLARSALPGASVVDLGCGTGAVLERLVASTGITDVTGVDPSAASLARTAERLGCPTHVASVLDPELPARLGRRFDVVLLVAVLHHLVGRTRRGSARLAGEALASACRLARPGGHVIVHEPVFSPRAAMWAVFHAKRAVSAVTPRRVPLLGYWNNIGAPVVSYLSAGQVAALAARHGDVVDVDLVGRRVHPLLRACGIRRRADTTVVVRRT